MFTNELGDKVVGYACMVIGIAMLVIQF